MNKNITIGVIAVAILVAGVIAGVLGGDTQVIEKVIDKGSSSNIGALTGPDLPYPYFGVGGVREFKQSTSLQTATTTVCAIQSPAATSTLKFAGIRFSTSSTTASTIHLAKATTAYATTTALGQGSLAAGAQGVVLASTTPTTGVDDNVVFGPSEYFVVGMTGGAGTFSPVGTCQATFEAF